MLGWRGGEREAARDSHSSSFCIMDPTRQQLKAEVDEALRVLNAGFGAAAAEVLQHVRRRFAHVPLLVVEDILRAGCSNHKYFQWIRPDSSVAFGLAGSWVAEEAALSDFLDLTMR